MRGEFLGVWSETWREIWLPLIDQPLRENDEGMPEDIFCELYRELAKALAVRPSVEDLADVIDSPAQARVAFENTTAGDLAGERALVGFLESVHGALEEFENSGDDTLTNRYFNLLAAFIEKFSLRYDLRRPCAICPTLPGIFASLVGSLGSLAERDANVARRLRDFKEALQDLRLGSTEARIGNCVSKQIMLLEAIASAGGASGTDLAALCKTVSDWPHPAVRSSLLNLYGFASDFPGVRHGTPSRGMSRDLDMRDMVAMSILLTGFTPHLNRDLSADEVYGGSTVNVAFAPSLQPLPMGVIAAAGDNSRGRGIVGRLIGRLLGRRA
jgi:hypothetical protein